MSITKTAPERVEQDLRRIELATEALLRDRDYKTAALLEISQGVTDRRDRIINMLKHMRKQHAIKLPIKGRRERDMRICRTSHPQSNRTDIKTCNCRTLRDEIGQETSITTIIKHRAGRRERQVVKDGGMLKTLEQKNIPGKPNITLSEKSISTIHTRETIEAV